MENSFLSLKYLKDHKALGMLILSFSIRESLNLKQKLCFITGTLKRFQLLFMTTLKDKTV